MVTLGDDGARGAICTARHQQPPLGPRRPWGGSHRPTAPCDIASRRVPACHGGDRPAAVDPAADGVVEAEREHLSCVPFGTVDQCAPALCAPHSRGTLDAYTPPLSTEVLSMKRSTSGGRTATGTRRGRSPESIDRVTDRMEARWGSLPSMEESLGMRVRLSRADLSGIGGEVLA